MFYYIVKIDYKEFTFTDPLEAMSFAETSILHQTEAYNVTLEIKKRESKDASHIDDEI